MADILRISLTGRMPGGEEWSINPVFAIGGDFGTAVSYEECVTIGTGIAAATIPTNLRAMNMPSVTWNDVKVEARTYAGVLETQAIVARSSPIASTGTQAKPFQTAVCLSLRTTTPGASGRGRLYVPATAAGLDGTTLRLTSAQVNIVLNDMAAYLAAIEAVISSTLTGVSLVVWSRKNNSTANVTSLQVGDVADVQTRRRDALAEAYTTLAWTP